ncbi:MAG: hypothetical protein K2Q22_11085 [Cytophagales bacterium]|nr:hypothetical protein [Cytophagales bacterium]
MENTVLIQLTNQKALDLLHQLEDLNLIKVIEENINPAKTNLSQKYRGVFSAEDTKNFDNHVVGMRQEWTGI